MRQRITIFNPTDSNDDIVQLADSSHLTIKSKKNFLIETKSTLSNALIYDLVSQLRITVVQEQLPNKIFSYNYANGLHVYVKPNLAHQSFDRAIFYQQTAQLIQHVLGKTINQDEWIQTTNSLYYYNVDTSAAISYPGWSTESAPITDFSWSNDQVVVKQLRQLPDHTEVSWKLGSDYQEIGLFMIDSTISTDDDIVLSGLRVVLDANEPSEENIFKTLFHIKPRHRIAGQVDHKVIPNGLHPKLYSNASFSLPNDDDIAECRLYYYVPINKSLIFDKYQSIPTEATLVIDNGETNLELPEYKIAKWGQEVLFEFPSNYSGPIEFTLHSRYQLPQKLKLDTEVVNSNPLVFYGCDVKDSYLLEKSPFDNRLVLGGNYESYFTNDTVFYHFENRENESVFTIPNGQSSFEKINYVSTIAISIGVLMVLLRLLTIFLGRSKDLTKKKNQ